MFNIHNFSGSGYEAGVQHGKALASKIKENWNNYEKLFPKTDDNFWNTVDEYNNLIEKEVPELYQEMQGIASGADIDLQKIIALNARSELMGKTNIEDENSNFSFNECTTLYSQKPYILSQNWDFNKEIGENAFLGIIEKNGLKIVQFMEPGIVGKIGMNSYGLAISLNFLKGEKSEMGLPLHVFMRLALEQKNLNEIKRLLDKYKTGKTGALSFAQGNQFLSIEFHNDEYEVTSKNDICFARTNHYIHHTIRQNYPKYNNIYDHKDYDSSNDRFVTAYRMIKMQSSIEKHKEILSNQTENDVSICMIEPDAKGIISIGSIVMDIESKTIHLRDLRSGLNQDWLEINL